MRPRLAALALLLAACTAPADETSDGLEPPAPPTTPPPAVVDSLAITPQSPVVAVGQPVQFTAPDRTVQGVAVGGAVQWTATGGTIDAQGVFTASGTGAYVVTAERGNRKGRTKVTVTPPAEAVAVVVAPATVTLGTGGSLSFAATGRTADGAVVPVTVTWSATGGTILATGAYTAGTSAGSFRVIAADAQGHADTATVILTPPAPTLAAVEVAPATATLAAGTSRTFAATGRLSDGTTTTVLVTWTATGGTIQPDGAYTAGGTAGTYRAIATHASGLADTATITVTVPVPPPPSALFPHAPTTSDWTAYSLRWTQPIPLWRNPVYEPDNGSHLVDYGDDDPAAEWGRQATTLDDASAPGGVGRVLHLGIPKGMSGGYGASKVGNYPQWNGNGPLRWDPSLSTGHLYLGLYIKASPQFNHNNNVGTKVLMLKSDLPANAQINHMLFGLSNDGAGGTQLWATYTPQNPFARYQVPETAQNDWNDGQWHLVEILQSPNTPGREDGTLEIWLDGRSAGRWTNAKFFDAGQVASLNRIEIVPIYGGGLNPVPKDQWFRLGPMEVRTK